MKKHICLMVASVLMIMGNSASYGLTLCARNSTYIGVLKKSPNGVSSDSDSTAKTWRVTFDYNVPTQAHPEGEPRVVTGLAACNEIDGTKGVAKTNLYTTAEDAGTKCWCKMEPVPAYSNNAAGSETGLTSYWVFLFTYDNVTACAAECAQNCASAMQTDSTFRANVYESIW